ncbi:MAG: hypothetical protein WAZ14_03630 [Patescibacteria group bacterium]
MSKLKAAILAGVLLLGIHAWVLLTGWYAWHKWFDIPMHIAGGAIIGVMALGLWEIAIKKVTLNRNVNPRWQVVIYWLGIIGCTALVGIAWEWYEFAADNTAVVASHRELIAQMGVGDTLADLFFDLLGATLSFLIWRQRSSL